MGKCPNCIDIDHAWQNLNWIQNVFQNVGQKTKTRKIIGNEFEIIEFVNVGRKKKPQHETCIKPCNVLLRNNCENLKLSVHSKLFIESELYKDEILNDCQILIEKIIN